MFYAMNFSVSNPRAMRVPVPDIDLSGIVPNQLSGQYIVIIAFVVVAVVFIAAVSVDLLTVVLRSSSLSSLFCICYVTVILHVAVVNFVGKLLSLLLPSPSS